MLVIKNCLNCGKEIKTKLSRIKNGNGKYCSRKCFYSFHDFSGKNNPQWKGDNVGYPALHTWVARQLGKPKNCSQCGTTTAKRYEWANISGKYLRDIFDYKRLCKKCHRAFDHYFFPRGEKHRCAKLTEKKVIKIRELYSTGKYSQYKLGNFFGVSQTAIKDIILKYHWKHI